MFQNRESKSRVDKERERPGEERKDREAGQNHPGGDGGPDQQAGGPDHSGGDPREDRNP